MNITLERIAELIPKDETGEFKHGAIKDFALSIGYKSGNIVSMWFNGDSASYKGKLHEIAAKYNVSIEWLKGESEQKEKSPAPDGVGLSEDDLKHLRAFHAADEETKAAITMLLKKFEKGESL